MVELPAQDTPTIDEKIAVLIALTERKRELEAELSEVNADRGPLLESVANDFRADGTQSIKRDGWNIHLKRDLSVKVLDRAALAQRLANDPDYSWLLSVQPQRFESFLRERLHRDDLKTWEIDQNRVPETMRDLVALDEYHTVGVRRA